jgi:ABC-type nitrate/sulfonate/bicarbonate transport system ATPase subunit
MSIRETLIELRQVSKTFPAARNGNAMKVFENLSLRIESKRSDDEKSSGDFVVLLGPSGCGKSTILSLMAGLTLPDDGEVWVAGERVTGPHRYSATVPQAYTCFPWLSALENVEFGLRLQGKQKPEREHLATDYLNKVGLAAFAHAYPGQLSGGMKQRVAIARTLAMKRPIVLMDEPFGALDAQTREDMQQMLLQLWEVEKNTIVFVTHDITEALLLADRVIVFSPGPARIIRDMQVPLPFERPPEIVHDPEFVTCAEELRQLLPRRSRDAEPLLVPEVASDAKKLRRSRRREV